MNKTITENTTKLLGIRPLGLSVLKDDSGWFAVQQYYRTEWDFALHHAHSEIVNGPPLYEKDHPELHWAFVSFHAARVALTEKTEKLE